MRFVALSLAVCAAVGCKEPEQKQQPPASKGEAAKRAQAEQPSLERPQAVGRGVVEVKKVSATITYSSTELKVDDTQLGVRLQNGMIPPPVLEQLMARLETAGASGDPIGVAVDPTLHNQRVFELLQALKQAGYRNVALIAGKGFIAIPLELVDADQLGNGIHPVVTVTGGRVILWSQSGAEGTSQNPKLVFGAGASMEPLTKALAEIVKRRWPDGMRPDEDRVITIQMSGREKAATLLQITAAVRAEGSTELFPTIYLAAGN